MGDYVEPPKAKYHLSVTITGNTLEEVEEEEVSAMQDRIKKEKDDDTRNRDGD